MINYNNPYNQYSYNNYGYQQPYNNQQYQHLVNNQSTPSQQQNIMNLLVVNNVEDVEKYIVMANQTVNFYDSKNGYIFVKSADSIGKYSTKAFKLNEIDINNLGKENNSNEPQYITRADLDSLETIFNEKIDKISNRLEKLSKTQQNNYNKKGNE